MTKPLKQGKAVTPAMNTRLQIAAQLLGAMLIEDRIAWCKDMECFGNKLSDLVYYSLQAADELIQQEIETREVDNHDQNP